MLREKELLDIIVHEEGLNTPMELLEKYALKSVVPGICTKCETVHDVEPDSRKGYCCGGSVVSCLVLAGII